MKLVRRITRSSVLTCGLAWLLSVPALGEPIRDPIVSTNVNLTRVDWLPVVDAEHWVLTVAGPGVLYIRHEFGAGQSPFLNLIGQNGDRLPDGIYSYELRGVPRVDRQTREALGRTRAGAGEPSIEELRRVIKLPENPLVHSGYLSVQDSNFVVTDPTLDAAAGETGSLPQSQRSPVQSISAQDIVHNDNLIVQGQACIGNSCQAGDASALVLKLKNRHTQIIFEDVADCCSPSRDWILRANDFHNVGEYFAILDLDASTAPLKVQGGTPDNSLYVRNNGNLGLGTSTPAQDIHAISGNTPALRLEQDGSAGLTARTWDVGANDASFFVRDVTNSSSQPFQIKAGAPGDSFVVDNGGNVGLGTASPNRKLHVITTGATENVVIEVQNDGPARIRFNNSASGEAWNIGHQNPAGNGFIISDIGDTTAEMYLDGAGNAHFMGTVTSSSSRTIKEEFRPVDSREILRRVVELPIMVWSYKATPGVRHVGPMSEDFFAAFAVGSDDKSISVTDSAGVALAAIQGLYQRIEVLEKQNATLTRRLQALEGANAVNAEP